MERPGIGRRGGTIAVTAAGDSTSGLVNQLIKEEKIAYLRRPQPQVKRLDSSRLNIREKASGVL